MKNKIKIKKSKVGSLHKALGVPKGEKIPASKLKIKSTDSPAIKKKKQFAINAKKFKHEDGGEIDMFPNGGTTNPPIYVTDPNDPRVQAYQDSLYLYNAVKDDRKAFDKIKTLREWDDYINSWSHKYPDADNAYNRLQILNKNIGGYKAIKSSYKSFPEGFAHVVDYKKPVQPIVYQPNVESSKPSLFNTTMPTEINPIPFKEGTYFTREQPGQEAGGKEYFDKKTGKKLGKFPFGGLSIAPLIGRKNQDLFNFNSLGISQTMQNSREINPQFGLEKVINTPPIDDPDKMAQWLAYSSSPKAKQDWMNKATPLQKSLSGLANPEGAEMLSGAFMKNGGKIKKKLKKYGDAGTVDIQPNDYWNYEGFSPQALPQTEQPYNLQIADYQSGYENAPIPENGFSSINLTEDQKRNMLSDKQKRKGFKPNIDQNIMTSDPYLNRVMQGLNSNNPVGFAKAGIAGSAGISNLVGNIKKNKFTRGQENNLLFNQIDGALYNPYNYDYNDYRFGQNRNQAFFEDGGIIHAPEMKGFFRKKKR